MFKAPLISIREDTQVAETFWLPKTRKIDRYLNKQEPSGVENKEKSNLELDAKSGIPRIEKENRVYNTRANVQFPFHDIFK